MLRKKFSEFGPRHEFNNPSVQIKKFAPLVCLQIFVQLNWIFVRWIENWKRLSTVQLVLWKKSWNTPKQTWSLDKKMIVFKGGTNAKI